MNRAASRLSFTNDIVAADWPPGASGRCPDCRGSSVCRANRRAGLSGSPPAKRSSNTSVAENHVSKIGSVCPCQTEREGAVIPCQSAQACARIAGRSCRFTWSSSTFSSAGMPSPTGRSSYWNEFAVGVSSLLPILAVLEQYWRGFHGVVGLLLAWPEFPDRLLHHAGVHEIRNVHALCLQSIGQIPFLVVDH